MNKRLTYIIGIVTSCIVIGCANVDVDDVNKQSNLPNAIYIDGAENSPMKKVVVDNLGGEVTFLPRAANLLTSAVQVDIAIDSLSLVHYNKKNETFYQLLPTEYYEIEKAAVTIQAGNVSAEPVKLKIRKSALKVNPSVKYAVPVKLTTRSSVSVLESCSYAVFVLERVLETSAIRQKGFYMRCDLADANNPMVLKEWTLHYGMKIDRWFNNQQPVMSSFYSRITGNGKLQYKPGGSDDPKGFSKQSIMPGKWYHITYTYKNQYVKAYINGVLEFELEVPSQNEVHTKIQASFGNFEGYLRDIRLYSKALSPAQIAENLYVENPANPDLLVYAPLDKELGLKDVSGNGRDFKAYKTGGNQAYSEGQITWQSPLYFPEK